MANKYAGTQTEKNLEAAFAGESEALCDKAGRLLF